jgi:hypothetical protein
MKCPVCLTKLEGHTSIKKGEDYIPEANDITLCFTCGAFLKFAGNPLRLQILSEQELIKIMKEDPKTGWLFIEAKKNIMEHIYERIRRQSRHN